MNPRKICLELVNNQKTWWKNLLLTVLVVQLCTNIYFSSDWCVLNVADCSALLLVLLLKSLLFMCCANTFKYLFWFVPLRVAATPQSSPLHSCCSLRIFFVTVRQQEKFNSVIEAVPSHWFSEKELLRRLKGAQGVSGVIVFGVLCQVVAYDSNCGSHPWNYF